jgi:hypothetical protein
MENMKRCDNCKDNIPEGEYLYNQGLCNECVENPSSNQE